MSERKKRVRYTETLVSTPITSVPYGQEFAWSGWWFKRIFSNGDRQGTWCACVGKFDGTRMRIRSDLIVKVKVEVCVA